ncbi:MAG: YtxH domain-containing protein [Clostridia bacterium]|nr:YtxH domain-containing protein [Clostridia bacterium]
MSRRGFLNGLLAGGVIGAAMALFVRPQMKPGPKKGLIAKTRRMSSKAGKVVSEVRDSVRDIKKILD